MNARNVGIVIKYEIISMLRKPSFWFFTFVFPILIMAFTFLPQIFAQRTITRGRRPPSPRRCAGPPCPTWTWQASSRTSPTM